MRKIISKPISLMILILSLCLMYTLGEARASIGPFGGNVRSLAVDPTDPNTLYAASGGVFKSTDGGGLWTEVNTGLTNRNVWILAIDPADSKTVYAGTRGNSIYVSYDGGQTWN